MKVSSARKEKHRDFTISGTGIYIYDYRDKLSKVFMIQTQDPASCSDNPIGLNGGTVGLASSGN